MTGGQRSLPDLLSGVDHVLLDFDGPVCSVFAGLPASRVAQQLIHGIVAAGGVVPPGLASERDPIAVLRQVHEARPNLTEVTDAEFERLEIKAAELAAPTPDAEQLLRACADSGRPVWIVSNNASRAVNTYLERHGLTRYVAGVFGRPIGQPELMKPNPHLLLAALEAAGAGPAESVFVGDTRSDVEAGGAAGVPTIGYANKPGKAQVLADAGAVAVVDSLGPIAAALVAADRG